MRHHARQRAFHHASHRVVQEPNFFNNHIMMDSPHCCMQLCHHNLSLPVTQQGVELIVHLSQEVIDHPVFTVSLQIEARKLESNSRKHIA